MVPRRLPRRAPTIGHRGVLMGEARGGWRARQGHVCRRVLLRGRDRNSAQSAPVRFPFYMCCVC